MHRRGFERTSQIVGISKAEYREVEKSLWDTFSVTQTARFLPGIQKLVETSSSSLFSNALHPWGAQRKASSSWRWPSPLKCLLARRQAVLRGAAQPDRCSLCSWPGHAYPHQCCRTPGLPPSTSPCPPRCLRALLALSVWRGVLLCAPSDVQDVLSPSKNLLPLTWALRAHIWEQWEWKSCLSICYLRVSFFCCASEFQPKSSSAAQITPVTFIG